MRALALPTHRGAPVTVDHCAGCRLVWFDALESVQLDGLGWVRLLRELEQGSGLPLATARVSRPACPVCDSPLTAVQNRTRFGLFAALECTQRHGHLHSHSGLLAERGLVRPLGAAERRALVQERRTLHCLNCGAAASAKDEACSYCTTALVVLDLPRLAHSLRLRLDGMGPSPQDQGRHVAWSCRGCGAALDPGRETSCSRCGHLVVVQELPDIAPLLEAAEAELDAAAAAEVQRRSRFAGGRKTLPPAAGPGAIETRRRHAPAPAATGWRRLLAGGWMPLVVMGVVAGAGAMAAWSGWQPVSPSTMQALRAERLSVTAGRSWIWLEAYRQLQPGNTRGLNDLRRSLFDLQLKQLQGRPPPAVTTVGSLLDAAAGSKWISGPDTLPLAWDEALTATLRALPAGAEPPEVEASAGRANRLVPSAPGVWIEAESRSRGMWALTIENTGPVTVLASNLHVQMRISFNQFVNWRCLPQAPGHGALPPRSKLAMACKSEGWDSDDTWRTAMSMLQQGRMPQLQWSDQAARTQAGFNALTNRQTADAVAGSGRLDAFLRAHAGGGKGPWTPAIDKAGVRVEPALEAAPALTLHANWQQLTPARRLWLLLTAWVGAGVAFCALALAFGERRGVYVSMAAAVPASVVFGRGEGVGSVLLVGMLLAVAAVAVFTYVFAYRVYRQAMVQAP